MNNKFLDQHGLQYFWNKYVKPLYNKADKEQFWSVIGDTYEDDIAAINDITNGAILQQGDICVVKHLIAGNKYQYTSYVYVVYSDDERWEATDGNYSADNVYFKEDFKLAGDYTQIGNITKGLNETKTLTAAGKSVRAIFEEIFTKELKPEVTQPTFEVSSDNIGKYEVGENVSVNYKIDTTPGSYSFGPETGITFDVEATFNGTTLTATEGTFASTQVTESTDLTIQATGKSTEGAMPKDNMGEDYPEGRIAAKADWSDSVGTLTGARKWFWGYKDASNLIDIENISAEIVRALENSAFIDDLTEKRITCNKMQQMIIAVPTSAGITDIDVINKKSTAPQPVTKLTNTVSVPGANNYDGIDYDIWYISNAAPDSGSNIYRIILDK